MEKRSGLERNLAELDVLHASLAPLHAEASGILDAMLVSRRELTARRRTYLQGALAGNTYVKIDLMAYGDDPNREEAHFRQYIAKEGAAFKGDVLDGGTGLLAQLYEDLQDDATRDQRLEAKCTEVRELLQRVASGEAAPGLSKPFQRHLQGLSGEQRDRLAMWWPGDTVRVQYRRAGANAWVDVKAGSKGQKSVAVLAFLLASGREPLVLDQPEDDLDNHVIYDLVVQRIREQKTQRQLVIATHNPNIVVNGDAEMVLALDFRGGQCRIQPEATGCLQEQGVREGICRVMEGGRDAFQRRYERIGRVVP